MIAQQFEDTLKQHLKQHGSPTIADLWNRENLLVFFPELRWKSPATESDDPNWESLKRFEGSGTLMLINDKNTSNLLAQLIATLAQPVEKTVSLSTKPAQLDTQFKWHFETQRDVLTEFTLTTHLEGQLRGTLFRRR